MNLTPIEKAIEYALRMHNGQTDKIGQPYILHPLAVMGRVEGEQAKVAAILHDTVEDTMITLDDLRRAGFDEEVVTIVDALTHRPNESYAEYVARAGQHPVARQIKLADLAENMTIARLAEVTEDDRHRLNRYIAARAYLLGLE